MDLYSQRFVSTDFIMINILFKSTLEKMFNLIHLSPVRLYLLTQWNEALFTWRFVPNELSKLKRK